MLTKTTKFLLCLLIVCIPVVWAQTMGGSLSGKITTPSGAPVANAAVTITRVDTNASQRVLTGPDGSFSIAGLAPGTYKVEVESAGFKRTSRQNVELAATGPSAISITLEPGSMSETVEIKGRAPVIQTENGEVSLGVYTRMTSELPIVDRNHQQIMQLQTGVTPPTVDFSRADDPARQREWATNGQTSNLQHADGVVNLEPFRGIASRVTPVENIQQINIATSSYTPEKGYAAGSITNVVTRPGTNDWHGSLFEFHTDNNLHARSPWNVAGNPTPRLSYNQFGATAGGHIVRDRFFFFGSYEGTYNRGQNTQFATVPTPAMRAGNFSGISGLTLSNPFTGSAATGAGRLAFANNTISPTMFNPAASSILPLIPAPNQPGLVNNLAANVPYENDWQKADGRIDGHFTENTHGFLRYGFSNLHAIDRSILGGIGASARSRLIDHDVVADIAHNFSTRLTTDFRFGYNRYDNRIRSGDPGLASAFGLSAIPSIQISGMPAIGGLANTPQEQVNNTFNWVNGWILHTSTHNAKFGVDVRRFRVDGFNNLAFGPGGAALFQPGPTLLAGGPALSQNGMLANSFASFLLGTPTAVGRSFFTETPTARQTQFAAWIGDTINLFQVVTLDFGVRYEVYSPWAPRRNRGAMFLHPANNTLSFTGDTGIFNTAQDWDLDNIAPRAGFAIRVTPRTALRGGYGINYFQPPLMWSGYMPSMFGSFQGVPNGFTFVPNAVSALFAMQNVSAPNLTDNMLAFNGPLNVTSTTRYETPYVQTMNLQLQQEFVEGMMLGLGYVGELGRHLPYHYELNQGLPGTGLAGLPLAAFGRTASTMAFANGVNSNYHALQVNLTKRMGHGFSFQGAYTWSKALGYTDTNGLLLNPFNRRTNYGPADYDRQHMLTIAHVWDLPFGRGTNHMNNGIIGNILGNWAINGVFTWSSGTPFTVFADPLFYGGPNGTVVANLAGPLTFQHDNLGFGTPFFNTSAFAVPAAGTFGSLGRNAVRGPGFRNYNFSLFKSFTFMDHYKLEFRGEAYNLTNSPHWGIPVANLNAPNFGTIVTPLGGDTNAYGSFGRQVNVAVRLLF